MMRFMLQENQQDEILIEREISYLKDYLHIQKLRLAQSDEITVEVQIDETPCHHSIAPMLRSEEHKSELQSLIRNSYAGFSMKKKDTHKNTGNRLKNYNKKNTKY